MTLRPSAWAALAAGVAALAPGTGRAGALDLYGWTPRAAGMGGAVVAEAGEVSAVFYNPAALVGGARTALLAGGLWSAPDLAVDRDRPAASPDLGTAEPAAFGGLTLGVRTPFAGAERAAVGVGAFVPSVNLWRAEAVAAGRPQLLRYQSLPDKLTLLLGAGWAPWPGRLALGAGAQVLIDIAGDVSFDADLVGRRVERRDVEVEVAPKASPTAGALWRPADDLRVGLAWRGALGLDYDIPARLDLGPALSFALRLTGTALYTPHTVTLGASWDPRPDVTVTAEAVYAAWSAAPDPTPAISVDLGGTLLEETGLGRGLDVRGRPEGSGPALSDTVAPAAGAEWRPADGVAVRAGLGWRPTPAPRPDGPANYVDTDAVVVSGGAHWTGPEGASVDVSCNVIEHMHMRTHKDDPQDPVGDYAFDGRVVSVQATLGLTY